MRGKILTHHVKPPIPDFRWDWCAYHDGEEESPWLTGWGRTEKEALEDLQRIDDELADDEEQEDLRRHAEGEL